MKRGIITLLFVLFSLFFAEPAFAGNYTDYIERWASSASGTYEFPDFASQYATGEPDGTCGIEQSFKYWKRQDIYSTDRLELTYSTPVYATGLYIHQTWQPYLTKVEIRAANETWINIWENVNDTCDFNLTFDSTKDYKVDRIRLTAGLQTESPYYIKEAGIDAVQLRGYQTYVSPATSFSSLSVSPSSVKRGEAVSFSAKVDNSELSISNVTAKITQPSTSVIDSALSLSSGNATSGTYTGSWTPSNTSETGTYRAYFYACTSQACNSSSELTFKVNSTLDLNASLKSQYLQGEEVQITGYIKDFNGNLTPAAISLLLKSGSFQKSISKSSSAKYNFSYRISLDDPAGAWTAEINATDIYNNSGKISQSFSVGEPQKTEQYHVEIVEPKDNSALKRGDKIRITAVLRKDSEKVAGASVAAKMPSGKQITLDETQPGVYSREFSVGLDETVGSADISVEGLKGELRGSETVSISLNPAELKIEPEIKGYKPGEDIGINAKVFYADGSPVTAEVNAFVGSQKIPLVKKDGFYSGIFKTEKEGAYPLKIEAKDGFGNSGALETKLSVYERNIIDYIAQNWIVILAVSGTVFLVLYKTGKIPAAMRKIRLGRLTAKEKKLEERRKKVQESYFSEKKIDKNVYERLMSRIEAESMKVRGEKRKLKE